MLRVCCLLLIAALASCTSYKPDGIGGGYSEIQLNQTTFKVKARGNGFTSSDRVEKIMMLRAADLTLQNGYSHFVIIGGDGVSTRTRFAGFTPSTVSTTGSGTIRPLGNSLLVQGSSSSTIHHGSPIMVSRSNGEIFIQLVKQGDPGYASSFDAKLIAGQLRSQVSGGI